MAAERRVLDAPRRQLKGHRFPFSQERIPHHCGAPTRFLKRDFSRARKKVVWRFQCRKCTHAILLDDDGNVLPPLKGNLQQLPFDRPQCCRHNMNIWRRPSSSYPEFPNKTLYFLWCRQPGCPHKGLKRAFIEDQGLSLEVTAKWRRHKGFKRVDVGERPRCRKCRRELVVFEHRQVNSEEQIRFGCWRHRSATSRWFHKIDQKWVPILPLKRGPRSKFSTKSVTLPAKLDPVRRPQCCGKPMRLHEFPPGTFGGYRYRLRCSECGKSRYLDANVNPLPLRKPGRPIGLRSKDKNSTRRGDIVIRERNKLIYEWKRRGWSSSKICAGLDSKRMPLAQRWLRDGIADSWTTLFNNRPRLAVRLFSVIMAALVPKTDRERAYYFHGTLVSSSS